MERREKAVKTVTEELMKANEIIGKLQAEVKTQQGKVRLRSSIAGEQEKLLGEKDKELGEIRRELEERRKNEEKLSKDVEESLKREDEHRGKVEELEKLLETKENVMNWLNKQVDKQVVEKGGGGAVGGKRGGRDPEARRNFGGQTVEGDHSVTCCNLGSATRPLFSFLRFSGQGADTRWLRDRRQYCCMEH